MARPATDDFVFPLQPESDRCMIERRRVEADDLKGPAVMLAMTLRTELRSDRCVITLMIPDPGIDFFVTDQALCIRECLADGMASRAMFDSVPLRMR
jgi:hypothetical protein